MIQVRLSLHRRENGQTLLTASFALALELPFVLVFRDCCGRPLRLLA